MFGFDTLRTAVARLAGSFNSLAGTLDTINAGVRAHVGLEAAEPEVLEDRREESARNGREKARK